VETYEISGWSSYVSIPVQLTSDDLSPADVRHVKYRWDADTEILSAQLSGAGADEGPSGSVGMEGGDGSWLILDIGAGRIQSVEVAVWPEVKELASLTPPSTVQDAAVGFTANTRAGDVAIQVSTRVLAESDVGRKTFHFRVGGGRVARTIRLASDLLLDVDERSQISGLWLLNVPPCPA
jgi:hypothetical protein